MFPSLLVLGLASAFLVIASHLTYFISAGHLFHHCTFIFFLFSFGTHHISHHLGPVRSLPAPRRPERRRSNLVVIYGCVMAEYERLPGILPSFGWVSRALFGQVESVVEGVEEPEGRTVLDELHMKYGEYVRVGMCW